MKISPRDILIIAAVGIVVVAVALVVLLVLPQNAKLKDIDAQIEETQGQISQSQALLAQRQTAKQRASLTATELLRLSNSVPESPELPALIIELQDLSIAAGLRFISLTPQQPSAPWAADNGAPEPGFLRIPMTMQVNGTWSDTVDFLQRLTKLPRQLRVTGVNVTEATDDATEGESGAVPEGTLTTVVGLEAYMIPADQAPATSGN